MQVDTRNKWKFVQGFTVVELLVIMALIGIIMSVAIPSYQEKQMRANRADVIAPLQQILVAQERFYANNRVYTKDLEQLGLSVSDLTTDGYILTARECKNSEDEDLELFKCVEIIATGQGRQAADGNIIVNTQGRSEREVMINGTKVYESI